MIKILLHPYQRSHNYVHYKVWLLDKNGFKFIPLGDCSLNHEEAKAQFGDGYANTGGVSEHTNLTEFRKELFNKCSWTINMVWVERAVNKYLFKLGLDDTSMVVSWLMGCSEIDPQAVEDMITMGKLVQ